MCSVGSLVPSRTICCCALLPRRAPHALRSRQTEVLASQAAGQLARRSLVRQVRGPRTRSAAEAAKCSFAAEAAAGDLMVVEDGPALRAQKEREQVAKMPC